MSWASPWFLLGTLAIAVPLWLHLLREPDARARPFSSLMLMEQSPRRSTTVRKLRYLLLMALRIGLLLLLALTFARPSWWLPQSGGPAEVAGNRIIAVDTSASMRSGQRWENARDMARSLIDEMAPGSQAMLVDAGTRIRVVADLTADQVALRAELDRLAPGFGRLDYGQLMQSLATLGEIVEGGAALHLVTDLQKTAAPVRFADLLVAESGPLVLHQVSQGQADNWYLDVVRRVGDQIQAGIRGPGSTSVSVSLFVEGQRASSQMVAIPASGQAQVTWPLDDGQPSGRGTRVRVGMDVEDALQADNQRFLVVNPEAASPVLVIGDGSRAGLYLSTALESSGLGLKVSRISATAQSAPAFTDFALVAATDLGALSDALARQLEDYMRGGGQVLAALGSQAVLSRDLGLAGLALDSGPARAGPAAVGDIDATHPALQAVSGLHQLSVNRYLGIQQRASDQVLVRLDAGDPLLLERGVGEGRLLLLTSSLDNRWNDLPLQPAFVSLAGELARYLTRSGGWRSSVTIGSTLYPAGEALELLQPGGTAVAVNAALPALADRPGVYQVITLEGSRLVAANLDPAESSLAVLSPEQVARWTSSGGSAPLQTAVGDDSGREIAIWRWLLLGLALILLLESAAGNRYLKVARQ